MRPFIPQPGGRLGQRGQPVDDSAAGDAEHLGDLHLVQAFHVVQPRHHPHRLRHALHQTYQEVATAKGLLGVRSRRYSMVVDDGVVKKLNVEEAPGKVEISGGDALLKQL